MFFPCIAFLYLAPFLAIKITNAATQTIVYPPSTTNTVNLRIEGQNVTIFEGPITSGPRNITLENPGDGLISWTCDGLNDKANPTPGNTLTDALDAAAKASGFTYDGFFQGEFNDFAITRVSTTVESETGDEFWGSLANYKPCTQRNGIQALSLCGCQQEVKAGDQVLWAYMTTADGNGDDIVLLKLAPTVVTVKKGNGFTVTVTNGLTGLAVKNASVDGVHTDANGKATLYLFDPGFSFQLKAHQTGSTRSNVMDVTVTN